MLEETYVEEVTIQNENLPGERHLSFSGAKNVRDLGGYRTVDGRVTRWRMLYRSDGLNKLTKRDLVRLSDLSLNRIIDLRAEHEKQQEPDRIPAEMNIRLVDISILDTSTKVWHEARDVMIKALSETDPTKYMLETNVELATKFTPQIRQFIDELLDANGQPVLFHCAAGKDRTGFAAAVFLRMLGVPQETVMEDYLLTNQYILSGYKWSLVLIWLLRGKRFANGVKVFMQADAAYLSAAFETIDQQYGSFDNYLHNVLKLTERDIDQFKRLYLAY